MPPQTNCDQHNPKTDIGVGYLVLTSRQSLPQQCAVGRLVGLQLR